MSLSQGLLLVPRPTDPPHIHVAGAPGDRVLLAGSGPSVGWGVLRHDLGLGGALARALAARTGAGVDVDIDAHPSLTVRGFGGLAAAVPRGEYTIAVITVGVNDALDLVDLSVWRRAVGSLIDLVTARLGAAGRLFITGVQPMRSIQIFDSPLGSIVDAHARRMNVITAQLCEPVRAATFVALPGLPADPDGRHRSKGGYALWGEVIARSITAERPPT